MQVVYSAKNRSLPDITDSLLVTLKDIVENITVQSKFCITHPDYKPLELPEESVEQFQKLPQDLQDKYLSLQLSGFLSGIYFTRSLHTILSTDEEIADSARHKIEENTTSAGVDVAFFDRLQTNNHGQGYGDPGWQVLRQEEDDNLIVRKDELTLHIKRDRHLYPDTQFATVGDLVSIRLPKNRVDSRNYIAISNAGCHETANPNNERESVCIYFNFGAEGAVIFMAELTQQLNELSIPFSFKVPYNPWDYKRCDSGRLYFKKQDYKAVKSILKPIYLTNSSHFNSECPFLTKILAPGLALAEEPNLKLLEAESFSQNRCQTIANGLLEAWKNDEDLPDSIMSAIIQQFIKNEIDLKKPYLNAKSKDIYDFVDSNID